MDVMDPKYNYLRFEKCFADAKKVVSLMVGYNRNLLVGETTWRRNVSNGMFEWSNEKASNEVPRDVAIESIAYDLFANKEWRLL